MGAGTYDLVIECGATFRRVFTWKDEAGSAINLTGYTAQMQIRKKKDGDILFTLTSADGDIVLGGAAGTITVEIPAAEILNTLPAAGVWDIELTSGSGFVTRLLEGAVTFSKQVTIIP